jgi:UDP-glucose 4-epimerase
MIEPIQLKTTEAPRLSLSGTRVLVTGASGFLGSHLVHRLSSAGAELYALSRSRRDASGHQLRWLSADLADWRATSELLATVKPDLVFHFGGFVSATPDLGAVRPTFDSLLASTVNLLTAATELGCRRVIIPGSMMEPPGAAVDVAPMSPYMAAKWAASAYARMFHTLYRTPVVIVRPSMTYGPGQPSTRLVPHVLSALLRGEPPKLSSGKMEADWTYIDDMTDGILAAALAPGVEGLTIDLGTGHVTTAREVVELLVDLLGTAVRPVFGALPDRPGERSHPAETRTARERLGWSATTSLRDGLRRTIERFQTGPPAEARES